jgi:adenylate cyclase
MDPVVLIVDDNEDNRFTLSMRLEACGYENIVTAENGREALEKMRQGPVDLVLLDIMMPELDGYGVLEELRTDTALRDIPVVMISALEDINSVVRCIELGATDYLTKPFNPALLKARVDNCIEKARYKAQEAAHLARIESEKRRADELLTTVLPRSIARALKLNSRLAPQRYEDVAVLFCDVVGFTAYSEKHPPETVFAELEALVDRFEEIAHGHGLEKIKTLGDAFMATANLLSPLNEPVRAAVACALDMVAAAQTVRADWAMRIGIDFGPVSAGIMGKRQSSSTSGAIRSTLRRGLRNTAGPAASMSAAAPGCNCAIGHRAARWDLSTSRARKRSRWSSASDSGSDAARADIATFSYCHLLLKPLNRDRLSTPSPRQRIRANLIPAAGLEPATHATHTNVS